MPPCRGIASVKAYVADVGGHLRARTQERVVRRLIDVTPAEVERGQTPQNVGSLPVAMAKLHHNRRVRPRFAQGFDATVRGRRRTKTVGELSEDRAEFPCGSDRLDARRKPRRLIFGRLGLGRNVSYGRRGLDRESERRRRAPVEAFEQLRTGGGVVRAVDLNRVEALGVVSDEIRLRYAARVKRADPFAIGKAARADSDHAVDFVARGFFALWNVGRPFMGRRRTVKVRPT